MTFPYAVNNPYAKLYEKAIENVKKKEVEKDG